MTSVKHPVYPVDYYPPQYIESRIDNPLISPPTRRILSTSVTAASNLEQFTRQTIQSPKENLSINAGTNQGRQSVRTHQQQNRIPNTVGQNIPKLIVNEYAIKQPVRSSTHSMINIESDTIPKVHTNGFLPNKTKIPTTSTEFIKQQPVVKVAADTQPMDGYWKTGTLFNRQGIVAIGPLIYNDNTYAGPYGINRLGAYIYYISISIFILLASIFLIMTVTFYSQKYPDPSTSTGTLAGMIICAFSFYLGIQLILVGIWSQKYRQENPKRKLPNEKPRIIYTPYGYYLYPQYFTSINEQQNANSNANILQPEKLIEVPPSEPECYNTPSNLHIIKQQQQPLAKWKANGQTESAYHTDKMSQTMETFPNDFDKSLRTKKQVKPVDDKPTVSTSNDRPVQVPAIHRTVIAQPSSKTIITSRENTNGEFAVTGDIKIEDINDRHRKIKKNKRSTSNTITNAFYN